MTISYLKRQLSPFLHELQDEVSRDSDLTVREIQAQLKHDIETLQKFIDFLEENE